MTAMALGIIGFGIMGERLLRAALAHDRETVTVAGVYDPAAAAQARLRETLPEVPVLASPEAAVAACDCLYIASPPDSHLDHARLAMTADRAFLSEKPLATDVAAARRFVDEVETWGGPAAVNFIFASSPAVEQIVDWTGEGIVGTPVSVNIELAFATWPRAWQQDAASWLSLRHQGGFTREVASHFLFLSQRLFGSLAMKSADVEWPAGDGSETAIAAELTAGSLPVRLTGRVGATEKADHNLWTLEGDAGAVRLRDWAVAEHRRPDGSWAEAADAMPNEVARPLVLRRQLDKLAAMVAGRPHNLASVREALDVQEAVEAILSA